MTFVEGEEIRFVDYANFNVPLNSADDIKSELRGQSIEDPKLNESIAAPIPGVLGRRVVEAHVLIKYLDRRIKRFSNRSNPEVGYEKVQDEYAEKIILSLVDFDAFIEDEESMFAIDEALDPYIETRQKLIEMWGVLVAETIHPPKPKAKTKERNSYVSLKV